MEGLEGKSRQPVVIPDIVVGDHLQTSEEEARHLLDGSGTKRSDHVVHTEFTLIPLAVVALQSLALVDDGIVDQLGGDKKQEPNGRIGDIGLDFALGDKEVATR